VEFCASGENRGEEGKIPETWPALGDPSSLALR
jgi:hypothetical protein